MTVTSLSERQAAGRLSPRTAEIRHTFDAAAPALERRRRRNTYYYRSIRRLYRRLVPPGQRVLEIGCGPGDLLAAVEPRIGIGVDLSRALLARARLRYPDLHFAVGDAHALPLAGEVDYVIWQDLVGHLDDVLESLRDLRGRVRAPTRLVLSYYSFLWSPALRFAERIGQKLRTPQQNWLSMDDLRNLLHLAGFRIVADGTELLVPKAIPGLAPLANEVLVRWPGLRQLALVQWFVAEPAPRTPSPEATVTVVIPCRNEAQNIVECVRRVPRMGAGTEIIVVDGASTDGTQAAVRRMIEAAAPANDLKLIEQIAGFDYAAQATPGSDPKHGMLKLGKGDAVRQGFAAARGDILMVLDADMTVAPEDLPKFYPPLRDGAADLVNGVRLVYPVEREAFRPLNLLGNKFFSLVFSWLLEQPIKDTLCGTKALRRADYARIVANRATFGNFDPFGDFDLLFGASHLRLRIVDMPIRYQRRVAGRTKVSVWRHGPLLLAMTFIGLRKLKWPRWRRRLRTPWWRHG